MNFKDEKHIWVVEILADNKWEPCAASAINRDDGRELLKEWKNDLPDDQLRLTKYVRQP